MGNNNTQLQFVIKAVDDASSALNSVKEQMAKLQGQVDQTSNSMNKVGDEIDKTKAKNESMATSVFKGVAAWDMVKEGIHLAVDALKESAEAFLDAQKKTDLTQATVQSMGMSFAKVKPILDAFGDSMLQLGIDNEQAELSAAKLAKLAGGDLSKGMELTKLAADMAASGMGDLESNTQTLAGVLSGHGNMAIRQFKLALDDTATTGDILAAIQAKVTMTAEQYAETIPGKIQKVKTAYGELQETIGGAFVNALAAATSGSDDMNYAMEAMKKVGTGLSFGIFEVVNTFVILGKSMWVTIEEAKLLVTTFEAVKDAMSGDMTKAHNELQAGFDKVNVAIGSLNKSVSDAFHPFKAMQEAADANSAALEKVKSTMGNVGDGIANMQKGATKDIVAHKDAIKELTLAYNDMMKKTGTDLMTMSDDHTKAMADITKSINNIKKSMEDLQKSYSQQQTDDTAAMADKVIASQQKISDWKKQLASTDDKVKQADIQKQIDTEQAGLDAVKDFTNGNTTAIAEAKRRAGLSQLQRDLEDYQKRKNLATQEFNDKMATLQQELAAEQQKQADEVKLYQDRTTKISEMVKKATDDYAAQSAARVATTRVEVNAEIQMYANLAAAISAVRTASSSAVSTYTVPAYGGKRETGGPVMMNTAYLVGEKGPELFVPGANGNIVPNHALNGSGNGGIVVYVTGNTISNQLELRNLASKVGEEIMRNLRLNQKIAI